MQGDQTMVTALDIAAMSAPALAVALDLYFCDPEGWPHPVRYIGAMAQRFESFAFGRPALPPRLAGGLGLAGIGLAAGLAVWLLVHIPILGILAAVYFGFAGLALGGLLGETDHIIALIDRGLVPEARTRLSLLVSRDTHALDDQGVLRTLAETLSENLNDAFVAPFFFLSVAGPAGLWVYKAVSTLDSMWGYKTPRYKEFGWAAAKTDDVLAFIPARLTALAMIGAGALMGLDWRSAYDNLLADSAKSESPNAGWPMAAAAWLVGGAMGGPAVYFGQLKEKPVIGPAGGWTLDKIRKLRSLVLASGLLAAAFLFLYFVLIRLASIR
jgi:adenosylcobinamide-phosphate synthase